MEQRLEMKGREGKEGQLGSVVEISSFQEGMPFLADVSHSCNSVQKEVGAGNALPNGAEGEACV